MPHKILHLGDVIVAKIADRKDNSSLYRLAGGTQERLGLCEDLVPYAGGFAALRYEHGGRDGWRITCYDHTAREISDVNIGASGHHNWTSRGLLATTPGAEPGPLVAAFGSAAVVFAPFAERWTFLRPLHLPMHPYGLLLSEPGRLLIWGWGPGAELDACRLHGSRLGRERIRYAPSLPSSRRVMDVAYFPRQGKLAVLASTSGAFLSAGPLDYADARTLGRADWEGGLREEVGDVLLAAPDGTHGIGAGRGAAIAFAQHPQAALIAQPMSAMTPADFSEVTGALSVPDLFPSVQPVLELLAACLEYRFGAEVAIGDAVPAPEADSIGLSTPDGP
jgi:hypothetical protein